MHHSYCKKPADYKQVKSFTHQDKYNGLMATLPGKVTVHHYNIFLHTLTHLKVEMGVSNPVITMTEHNLQLLCDTIHCIDYIIF